MDQLTPTPTYRIGIDVGGTFTDLVFFDHKNQVIITHKVISTPSNPAIAILRGLQDILGDNWLEHDLVESVTHGSTVATNALLERNGARTALITTEGFKDVYKIGRQNRADLYDLNIHPTPPLIDPSHAFEVEERITAQGKIQIPLSYNAGAIQQSLLSENIDSVAVSLLFSFANPIHERELGQWLEKIGFFVSLSSDVMPEFREYERTSTTLVNAYVSPILKVYLRDLEMAVGNRPLRIMQSNGGSISAPEASRYGVRCILSGPAGGVAAAVACRDNGLIPSLGTGLITFDMGGTSTDVSLIKLQPSVIKDAVIGGFPVAIPVLDIHTIGAGGGSIAYFDEGFALRVGPRSAGADPGPACYGKGDLPTVTDANLALGRIMPDYFLGGAMRINKKRAEAAIQNLAMRANLSPLQCAQGILEITNIHMAKALRVISVERGEDPDDYLLVSFGGAGGLHAVDLAKLVGISRVFIPDTASVFSAFGMLTADAVRDYSQTVMYSGSIEPSILEKHFRTLEHKAFTDLTAEGFELQAIQLQRQVDVRYKGQSFEITTPYTPDYLTEFHAAHKRLYGYDLPGGRIEIVNVRVKGTGKTAPVHRVSNPVDVTSKEDALLGTMPVYLSPEGEMPGDHPELVYMPAYHGELLPVGASLTGPMLIVRKDTTILAEKGDLVNVIGHGSLLIDIGKAP